MKSRRAFLSPRRWLLAGGAALALSAATPMLLAQDHGHGKPHAAAHAKPAHGKAAHGGGHAKGGHGHHGGGKINWAMGLLGEKEGLEEATLLYRPKGMPVPMLANVINLAVLLFLFVHYGKKPLMDGLKERRDDIMREIDDASKTKKAARKRFKEYEGKLEDIDAEIKRIKDDYAAQAKADKARILKEAEEKRDRLKRDATFLLEQERKIARKELMEATVQQASAAAEDMIRKQLAARDQERLANEYLDGLKAGGAA